MDRLFGLDSVSSHDEGLELLMTVYDPAELMVAQSVLKDAEIPFLCKDRGSGGMMKIIAGYSVMGTDIFVPEEVLEHATELLDAYRNGEEVVDEEMTEESAEDGEEE